MYIGVNKLKQIENEINQNKTFKKDKNIKKGRSALENFIKDVEDGKITNKQDLTKEYLEKVKIYKNKIEKSR